MAAGTALLSVSLSSTDSAGGAIQIDGPNQQITRASDLHNKANGATSGTPNTNTAIALGPVPDAEMLFTIRNTDPTAGHYILVQLNFSGTYRTIAKVGPGECFPYRILSAPYVQSPVASVTYEAEVAAA